MAYFLRLIVLLYVSSSASGTAWAVLGFSNGHFPGACFQTKLAACTARCGLSPYLGFEMEVGGQCYCKITPPSSNPTQTYVQAGGLGNCTLPTCPAGQEYVGTLGKCMPVCGTGQNRNAAGVCECPSGTAWQSDEQRCKPDSECDPEDKMPLLITSTRMITSGTCVNGCKFYYEKNFYCGEHDNCGVFGGSGQACTGGGSTDGDPESYSPPSGPPPPDKDSDGDGTPDYQDPTPNGPPGDRDSDGIPDSTDPTPDGPDTDGDGNPDHTDPDPWGPDRDYDGIPDSIDPEPDGPDRDRDGIPDYLDPTPGGNDQDQDGIPDNIDPTPQGGDKDQDGIPDIIDPTPTGDQEPVTGDPSTPGQCGAPGQPKCQTAGACGGPGQPPCLIAGQCGGPNQPPCKIDGSGGGACGGPSQPPCAITGQCGRPGQPACNVSGQCGGVGQPPCDVKVAGQCGGPDQPPCAVTTACGGPGQPACSSFAGVGGAADGTDCDNPPACTGDPIQCAIAKAAWETACRARKGGGGDGLTGDNADVVAGEAAKANQDRPSEDEFDIMSMMNTEAWLGSTCPSDVQIQVGSWVDLNIPFSSLCGILNAMGLALVGISFMSAIRIIAV